MPGAPQQAAASEPWRILRWRSRIWAHQEPLAQGVALTMVRIPAGSFLMGAPETEAGSSESERPVHRVTLREFLLGQTPITQAQWRAVAEWERPLEVDAERWPEWLDLDPVGKLLDFDRFRGDQRPVVNVSWRDANAFCQRLRLRTGKNYGLPSEAQWEYACRAGTTTPFHFGETINTNLVNYDGNYVYGEGEIGAYLNQAAELPSSPANPWGLYDMHGNVWEWSVDHWHTSYAGAPKDGRAWIDNGANESQDQKERLLRGGSWLNHPGLCRSAYRGRGRPESRSSDVGFRVCCLPQD